MADEPPAPHDLWVHDTIQDIFALSLVKGGGSGGGPHSKTLEALEAALPPGPANPNGGHLLTLRLAEAALVECLAQQADATDYLSACWSRAHELLDAEPRAPSHQSRLAVLDHCLRLCGAYLALTFQHDDLFTANRTGGAKLVHTLASSSGAGRLLEDVMQHVVPATAFDKVFIPATEALIQEVLATSIADDWQSLLKVLSILTGPEAVCKAILASPLWLPSGNGHMLEHRSLLGAFFALSATHPKARSAFLPTTEQGHIDPDYQWDSGSLQNLRSHWGLLMELLQAAVMQGFLRPKYSRDALLRWIAAVLNQNAERSKTQVDYNACSSDCFMINFAYILFMLFDPVIVKDKEKRDTVVASYVTSASSRLNYDRFTRIAMDADAARKAHHADDRRDFNFNTEAFFFALHGLHLGLLSASNHWQQTNREIRELKQAMQDAAGQGLAPVLLEFQKTQFQIHLSNRLQLKYALDALLFNPTLVHSVFRFCDYTALWLLRMAFDSFDDDFRRPLPTTVPKAFAALPEFFLDSVVDLLLLYLRYGPRYQCITHDLDVHHLILMIVHFMPSSRFITNPYVRSKFPEILYVIAMIEKQLSRAGVRSLIADTFQSTINPAQLVPGLMTLYVDMEFLGGHNQFYEKFTPRYYVAELFNYLWPIPAYKQAFQQEATDRLQARTTDHFVKFFNYLLNDANFLMEESLTCLKQINEFEQLQANPVAWNALSQTERADKTKAVEDSKGRCKSFMRLGTEAVNMMEYLSKELPGPFLQPELVDKVAAMLGYFLDTLVGKSLKDLKVTNAWEYSFNHRALIEKIAHTFVHFSPYPEFHRAVAGDGRSYSPERFEQALLFVRAKNILDPNGLQQLSDLAANLKKAYNETQVDEEMYEDVPDHFLDPINYAVMSDPVKLPTSGNVVERAVIVRHLLNDETDPFNRAKLTVAALEEHNAQPAVASEMAALRAEIEEWKRGKRG